MKWLTGLLGIAPEIIKARTGLKIAEIEAKSTAMTKAADSERGWEGIAAESAASSWKDEFWTLVLAIPMILSFVPFLQPYVRAGFEALTDVPEWYRWAVLASISFAFARKTIPSFKDWKIKR